MFKLIAFPRGSHPAASSNETQEDEGVIRSMQEMFIAWRGIANDVHLIPLTESGVTTVALRLPCTVSELVETLTTESSTFLQLKFLEMMRETSTRYSFKRRLAPTTFASTLTVFGDVRTVSQSQPFPTVPSSIPSRSLIPQTPRAHKVPFKPRSWWTVMPCWSIGFAYRRVRGVALSSVTKTKF